MWPPSYPIGCGKYLRAYEVVRLFAEGKASVVVARVGGHVQLNRPIGRILGSRPQSEFDVGKQFTVRVVTDRHRYVRNGSEFRRSGRVGLEGFVGRKGLYGLMRMMMVSVVVRTVFTAVGRDKI